MKARVPTTRTTAPAQAPRRRFPMRGLAVALLVAGVLIASGYAFAKSPLFASLDKTSLVYSQSALLNETWSTYKADWIEAGSGRTLDSHTSNITSSSSQAQTMLRAVWTDDKQTFDGAWGWTHTTTQRLDGLIAGQYGPRGDGSYGIVDARSDSAADTDTALALLMAYGRWNDVTDLTDAKTVINALYETSVVTVNGSPVLVASDAGEGATVALNPAALNVAAFKEFAKVDPSHDWTGLATTAYAQYSKLLDQYGGRMPGSVGVSTDTGNFTATPADQVFGPNAATAVWNLGLDYAWNRDPRDLALMKKLPYAAEYATTGSILTAGSESAATYGKLMPYLGAVDPSAARSVMKTKLTSLYNQDQQSWTLALSDDDATWAWNGIAFYNGALRQLTEIR